MNSGVSRAQVDHLSVYDVQFEAGTEFHRRFPSPGLNTRPSDEEAAQLYEPWR